MALLSNGHVSLFNPSLTKLTELLLTEPYSGTDIKTEYSTFILDRHLAQKLDPDEDPYENLVESF